MLLSSYNVESNYLDMFYCLSSLNYLSTCIDITGVPHFEVYLKDKAGPHQEFSGAQSVETFVAVFRKLKISSRM